MASNAGPVIIFKYDATVTQVSVLDEMRMSGYLDQATLQKKMA
tara:strand:- start:602 stop:730 length:129 start_codon:yes stop_codon:yes gene_type:complete